MKVDVLLGLQWGDEGKGKIVDVLTPKYDIIARFQGGPNAGHTLEFDGIKHVLHTIPSGIFRSNVMNVVGNGVVIDPVILKKEIDALTKLGVDVNKRMVISKKAHLILPTHRLIDAASEASKGKEIRHFFRDTGNAYITSTLSSLGSFILQDNMFNRISRKANGLGTSALFNAGGSNISIIAPPGAPTGP